METTKVKMEFNIIECKGRTINVESRYPNKAIFSISSCQIRIYKVLIELMKFKKGSEIIFAKHEDEWFIANSTNNYKRGHRIALGNSIGSVLISNTSAVVRRGLSVGIYEIKTVPIYDEINQLDWFKLMPLKLG